MAVRSATKNKSLQSLSLADCGKAREITAKNKERNLEISSARNPIAVWVEGNEKASTLVLTVVSIILKLLYNKGVRV